MVCRMERITLGDNQIESLINGGVIRVSLSDGKTVEISQSLMKDLAAPLINHDKKIFSNQEIENIRLASASLSSSMEIGR